MTIIVNTTEDTAHASGVQFPSGVPVFVPKAFAENLVRRRPEVYEYRDTGGTLAKAAPMSDDKPGPMPFDAEKARTNHKDPKAKSG